MKRERTHPRTATAAVPRVFMLFICLAAVLSLWGCGSDATGSGAASVSPAEASLIGKAEVVCNRVNREIKVAEKPGIDLPLIARLSPLHAAAELRGLHELEALTAPSSLEGAWRRMLAYRQTLVNELIEFGHDAKAGNLVAIRELSKSKEHVHLELLALARRRGFRACAIVG
jgi:hypothetical protein